MGTGDLFLCDVFYGDASLLELFPIRQKASRCRYEMPSSKNS